MLRSKHFGRRWTLSPARPALPRLVSPAWVNPVSLSTGTEHQLRRSSPGTTAATMRRSRRCAETSLKIRSLRQPASLSAGQWAITKHRWLLRHVPSAANAVRRFNIAEWIVRGLGGDEVTELALACRTGWLDLARRDWWTEGLAWSGATPALLPPLVEAGTPVGQITSAEAHPRLRDAVLTVVGHDHQAAAVGVGATGEGDEVDSCGSAEAIVRTIPAYLKHEQVRASGQRRN